jgi:lipoprotein-releasing system permease protein
VAVAGVAVGVMAVLISLGLMTGLQSEIRSRILGATAHLSVFPSRGASAEGLGAVVAEVRSVPGVAARRRRVREGPAQARPAPPQRRSKGSCRPRSAR